MGLKERRAIKDFQDNHFPKLCEDIKKAAEKDIEIEVDWDSLAIPKYSEQYADFFTKIYFLPLIGAFENICIDEMGKEALAESVQRIHICNKSEQYGEVAYSLKDGVLTVDHIPNTNSEDVDKRVNWLTNMLEDAL